MVKKDKTELITTIRLDKTTTQKLNILISDHYKHMSQNHAISKAISDALYFREMLKEKSIYVKEGDEIVRLKIID